MVKARGVPKEGGLLRCCFGGRHPEKESSVGPFNAVSSQHDAEPGCSPQLGWPPEQSGRSSREVICGGQVAASDRGEGPSQDQGTVTRLVSLLQELLSLSTSTGKRSLPAAMTLLCQQLNVSWASLTVLSRSGASYHQVCASLAGEFERTSDAGGGRKPSRDLVSPPMSLRNLPQVPPPYVAQTSRDLGPTTPPTGQYWEEGARPLSSLQDTDSSIARVMKNRLLLQVNGSEEEGRDILPADWESLRSLRRLVSFLAVPVTSSNNRTELLGVLSFGRTDPCIWEEEWWMPSTELICGWAAGALQHARAVQRCSFLECLRECESLSALASTMVHTLPYVLTDQKVNQLQCHLGLVSSSMKSMVVFGATEPAPDAGAFLPESIVVGVPLDDNSSSNLEESGSLSRAIDISNSAVSAHYMETHHTLLMCAIDSGEVVTIKDTVGYFSRNSSVGRDLCVFGRPLVKGTLLIIPLIFKYRALGGLYLYGDWDVNASVSRQVLAELGEMLSDVTFRKLVTDLRVEWTQLFTDRLPAQEDHQAGIHVPVFPSSLTRASSNAALSLQGSGCMTESFSQIGPTSSYEDTELENATSLTSGQRERLPLTRVESSPNSITSTSKSSCCSGGGGQSRPPLWAELLDIEVELMRSRHTSVYVGRYNAERIALKVFRCPSSIDERPKETDMKQAMRALYKMSALSHPNVVRILSVFPNAYEVSSQRSLTSSSGTYLTAVAPSHDKHTRCIAVATEYLEGAISLREAMSVGLLAEGHGTNCAAKKEDLISLPITPAGFNPAPNLGLLRAILEQVAAAMKFIHGRGLLHSELRTENLLIQVPELGAVVPTPCSTNDLQARLSSITVKAKDVGLCMTHAYGGRQVTVKKLVGRPRPNGVFYLAPEVFRGEGLSRGSDIYAFGLLMWELYTGQVAFSSFANAPSKTIHTMIQDGVRPLFPESAPGWYSSLAARCWHPVAKNRPSFRKILAALQAVDLHGEHKSGQYVI